MKVLTPTAKRTVIESMVSDHQLSRCKACKILGFSLSALYKPKTDWAAKDAPVIDALNEIIEQRARLGFCKGFTRMRKDGKTWNHKKVHRVSCDMKLNLQQRTKKRVMTHEWQPLGIATKVNVVWTSDFMPLYYSRPFITLNMIDEGKS